jgi:hypothetical protein
MRNDDRGFGGILILGAVGLSILLLALLLWPRYRVYSQTLSGQAKLEEAKWSTQIVIEEARAQEQASLLQAQARITLAKAQGQAELEQAKAKGLSEIERAKATAEANKIIGASLKGNEEYLRYLWILGIKDGTGERIYIPTEAGLPILEAGAFASSINTL